MKEQNITINMQAIADHLANIKQQTNDGLMTCDELNGALKSMRIFLGAETYKKAMKLAKLI